MSEELSDTLRIGRLEDKFNLYEPMLKGLYRVASISTEFEKIQMDLQLLKESRVSMSEQLTTLFKGQDKVYGDTVRSMEKQASMLEKEIAECPISEVSTRLIVVERDIISFKQFDQRISDTEGAIESFKLRGWDLLFRIVPWAIAFIASSYAVLGN